MLRDKMQRGVRTALLVIGFVVATFAITMLLFTWPWWTLLGTAIIFAIAAIVHGYYSLTLLLLQVQLRIEEVIREGRR